MTDLTPPEPTTEDARLAGLRAIYVEVRRARIAVQWILAILLFFVALWLLGLVLQAVTFYR